MYHFLEEYAAKNDKQISSISDAAMSYLRGYRFPGNVRELENIIERAIILCKGTELTPNELPDTVKRNGYRYEKTPGTFKELNQYKRDLWEKTVVPVERNFALNLLESCGGNVSAAARLEGMHRKQLQRILAKVNIKGSNRKYDDPDGKPV